MLAGFAHGEARDFDLRQVTAVSLGAFVYLVLVGAIVGYTAYIWLLRHCDPSKVATYAYVNPVIAVLLGTFFAGETLTLRLTVANEAGEPLHFEEALHTYFTVGHAEQVRITRLANRGVL